MNFKKIIAVSAVICVSLGIFALRSPAVLAAEESLSVEESSSGEVADAVVEGGFFDVAYEATDEYKSSKYYENLKNVPRTGNQAINVIAIALSQVGYHEGNDESEFHGLNTEGTGDFVEYNKLYGIIDYNVRYGYAWCASFATWCLRQADVSVEQSAQTGKNTYISTRQWKDAFENAGAFVSDKKYVPVTGDIIFFKDVDDKTIEVDTSHVGIVLYSDGKNVYTVEGNTNTIMGGDHAFDCVAVKSYTLDSKYIVGYGKPKYKNNNESVTYVWRDSSKSDSDAKPLEKIIDDVKAGVQFVPEKYVEKIDEEHGCATFIQTNIISVVIMSGIGVFVFKKRKCNNC